MATCSDPEPQGPGVYSSYRNHNRKDSLNIQLRKALQVVDDSSKVACQSCAFGIILMNLKRTLRFTPALRERLCWSCLALPSTSTTHGEKKGFHRLCAEFAACCQHWGDLQEKAVPHAAACSRWTCGAAATALQARYSSCSGCRDRGESGGIWSQRAFSQQSKLRFFFFHFKQASFAATVETLLLWHSESHSSDTLDNCFFIGEFWQRTRGIV